MLNSFHLITDFPRWLLVTFSKKQIYIKRFSHISYSNRAVLVLGMHLIFIIFPLPPSILDIPHLSEVMALVACFIGWPRSLFLRGLRPWLWCLCHALVDLALMIALEILAASVEVRNSGGQVLCLSCWFFLGPIKANLISSSKSQKATYSNLGGSQKSAGSRF